MLHRVSPALLLVTLATLGIACEKKHEGAQGPLPDVVVAPVEKKDVEIYSEWIGTTTGYVNAQIYPKVEGYLLKQDYVDGSVVKEGDLLFQIDPRQFQATLDQARGQLARSQAVLVKNEQDVRRYTPLVAQGAVSRQELDDATQARAASAAQVEADRATVQSARLNLEWTQVKAPITGVAGIASAQVGDLVSPSTLLTSISQLDPIKVTFPVSEIEYLRFAKRVQAAEDSGEPSKRADLQLILANGERYPEPGRFSVAGLAVATTTGTINIQGLFPNPDNLLRPGQFAKVRAVTDRFPGALVVPQRAVRDLQGMSQVAVVGPDDKVTFRTVKLGPATGSDYVVSEGLEAGDRVIVEGLQKVRDGVVVKPVAAQPGAVPAPAPPAAAKPAPGK
ncbi:MAG TPA: efflux RND transporter periplasmic adaptor subunit [Myxococcota bacterium]|nr:efflux RND transporter periplasmic adaptor subunit [Myxococcota bacterium]